MDTTVGVIGLGVLGSAMAANIAASGFPVVGCDADPAKLKALADQGIEPAATPVDVATQVDVVVLTLPTADALADVVGGEAGLDKDPKKGQVVIDAGTFAVADKERARDVLAAAGKVLLDCPVSGNRILAVEKRLTSFGSGDRAAYDSVEHVIAGYTNRRFHVGEFGCGMKMKFCANILNLVHNSVAAEVIVLGMKSGLDPALLHDVISGSGSSSSMFETRGALMVRDDYDHEGMNFSIPLKDAPLISAHAADLRVPIPIYQAALQLYYAAVAQGHFDEDAAAVCRAVERAANFERVP